MSKAKILLACFVWLILLSIGVGLYRWWYVPSVKEQTVQHEEQNIDNSNSDSIYRHTITVGLDKFSGYAILRSETFKQELRKKGIKLELRHDEANYEDRLAQLATGDIQLAAFPIDALLKAGARAGKIDATIIALLDETQGADAIVAYKQKFPNITSLNSPDTRFVLVGDSPSETLVRLVLNTFDLDAVSAAAIESVDESELLSRFRNSKPGGGEVFVTWEPLVSQMVKDGQVMHRLYDSSKQSGVIVDALVVSRYYLINNEPVVRDFLEAYLTTRFSYGNDEEKLLQLVKQDAAATKTNLNEEQAKQLVQGIVWKNTQDNLAHFGLRASSVSHIEDMIDRIGRILRDTGGMSGDPTRGKPNDIYYVDVLRSLQEEDFYPGVSESVSEDAPLKRLSQQQWSRLQPVGTVDVPPLIYARGTSKLTQSSQVKLDSLLETLNTFPRYYLQIEGHASSRGNADANRKLAKQRAEAALQYLLDSGVPANRLKTTEGDLTGKTSVTFVLAEMPY